jgi:transcriptional regulator with XRE-family HTH domain
MRQSYSSLADFTESLGRQIRDLRLLRNLDQRTLAARAGVALNAVKRLESGAGATVGTLIKVLRALDRADWLATLAPEVSISPLQLLERAQPRQRATGRRKRRGV